MANEVTAELSDEQFKKYQILQDNNMGIGDAIDLIFDLRDELQLNNEELIEDRIAELNVKKQSLEEEIDKVNQELGVIDKLKDNALDLDAKAEILEKEYAAIDDSYDMKVQALKRNIKWGKLF